MRWGMLCTGADVIFVRGLNRSAGEMMEKERKLLEITWRRVRIDMDCIGWKGEEDRSYDGSNSTT
eukprot:8791351-Karenia_brevis.AAC.1